MEIKRLSEIKVLLRRAGYSQGRQKAWGGIRQEVRYRRSLAGQGRVGRKAQRREEKRREGYGRMGG